MVNMTNPRVFMIGWEYPPHNSGGLGVACDGLTRSLAEQGTQIYFTLPFAYPGGLAHVHLLACFDPDQQAVGLPFASYYSPVKQKQLQAEDMLELLPRSEMEMQVREYSKYVSAAGENYQATFEVIHAHDWMSFSAGIATKKRTGKPLIAHIHSTEFDRIPHGHGSDFIHSLEAEGLQLADKVIAVSQYTKDVLVSEYQVPPEKIEVIYNGINPLQKDESKLINFAADRPVVVFMGRLTSQKGAEYFITVARQVLEKMPQALFILAGSGDQYQSLLFRVAKEKLSVSVLFSGFLRGADKDMLLSRADVFVMPSLSEPFGLVALEAAQREVPVIVSKTAGVAEVLAGAIQIDFWDTQAMSAEIFKLLTQPQYKKKIVQAQSKSAASTSWQQAAGKVRSLYQKIVRP